MIFFIHYVLMTSGLSGTSVLLAVFFKSYTDASQAEIGALLMSFPFVGLVIKPLFCSMADRRQAHRLFLILSLIVEMVGYAPFAIIPFFPDFYTQHPRISWYVLAVAGHVGSGGLAVGWSLGDCLAVNYSQKTGIPFGRMRMMGTLSWGVYGFIIGQINETPALPKFTPAFLILHSSLLAEIIIVLWWSKEDFKMIDPLTKAGLAAGDADSIGPATGNIEEKSANNQMINYVESTPSSLMGTLRLNPKTANVFRDVLASDELHRRLKGIDGGPVADSECHANEKQDHCETHSEIVSKLELGQVEQDECQGQGDNSAAEAKNPQLLLLKMILFEDGRVIKYVILFTIFGAMISPLNFMFLSMEELCKERDYNFSQLAGAVLISQALIETLAFLVVPWCMQFVTKSAALSFGFAIISLKFIFYSGWYYTTDISPYWAVVAEWSHGIGYGIFATILADVSLMFANQSRLFIPELRKLGYLSEAGSSTKERIAAEELSIKMALRATMQALFGGFMDGLGQGAGALLCGVLVDMYSYTTAWKMFFIVAFVAFVFHLAIEYSKTRWSDSFKPRKGTKAFEIMQLTRAFETDANGKKKVAVQQRQTVGNNHQALPIKSKLEDPTIISANQQQKLSGQQE